MTSKWQGYIDGTITPPKETDVARQAREARAEREVSDRRLDNLKRAGVRDPAALAMIPFADEAALATTAAMRGAMEHRAVLTMLFAGPAGSGKSWASYFLVREQSGGMLMSFCDVVPHESWNDVRPGAVKAALLVIDDFGMGPLTAWRDAEVESIVCRRHEAGHRTVMSSNLPVTDVLRRFGDRFARRVGAVISCAK